MHSATRAVLKKLRSGLSPLKPILQYVCEVEASLSSYWACASHRRLMFVEWGLLPQPENFDHQIDLYYFWQRSRNPQWLERGVYGGLALTGGKVLELCCGDGFNARNFYSLISESIVACDFDPQILKTAKRKNRAPNVSYVKADIRTEMPEGVFDNVIWDAAIEHFTPAEIEKIITEIRTRLSPAGILSGHTVVEKPSGSKQLSHHEYEFKNKEDLQRFLTPYFKNAIVFETKYPERHNLYFWASDGPVPFSPGWANACKNFSIDQSDGTEAPPAHQFHSAPPSLTR